MDLYSLLRQLADSWGLLALFIFFLGVWVWAFRPGSRPLHDEAADVIFRHDDGPLEDDATNTNTRSEGQS
ncbi:cbb3-type cytochrome c oxidase subunit 3 [Octadecabacter sp. CECT 8868]|uniref:cbb3-type cytochrome c oxidase subunit 3 n=1 Tax=Octadecabacter algicola TaxID=2909342 RepID=UPI001F20F2BE|nr:cbb3-type cytochrome c oxidase subunit 3 [Octadecabacter algicola]MCF2905861.1 cbb3-type cytochrome c oxidase subunit 3 [Octadecabacter algicola]